MEEVESEARLKLDVVEKELGDVRRSLERLWRAVETSEIELSEILPRLREQQSRQASLEQTADGARAVVDERRALLGNAKTIGTYAKELGGLIESSDVVTALTFLRSFVKEIIVTSDVFTIRYILPTPRGRSAVDDDQEEGLPDSVLATVPVGARWKHCGNAGLHKRWRRVGHADHVAGRSHIWPLGAGSLLAGCQPRESRRTRSAGARDRWCQTSCATNVAWSTTVPGPPRRLRHSLTSPEQRHDRAECYRPARSSPTYEAGRSAPARGSRDTPRTPGVPSASPAPTCAVWSRGTPSS